MRVGHFSAVHSKGNLPERLTKVEMDNGMPHPLVVIVFSLLIISCSIGVLGWMGWIVGIAIIAGLISLTMLGRRNQK